MTAQQQSAAITIFATLPPSLYLSKSSHLRVTTHALGLSPHLYMVVRHSGMARCGSGLAGLLSLSSLHHATRAKWGNLVARTSCGHSPTH